jgi:peptidoglycan/LPS O-acetylase OafA/YrhL
MSQQTDYRADIDGLRAGAVLLVIGYHFFPSRFPGGYVGVDIFFVISGFLITGILVQELEQRDFSISRFYARRIRRIFPAWVTILAASLIAGWALNAAYRYYMSARRPFGDPPSARVRAVQRDRTAAAFATARQSKNR